MSLPSNHPIWSVLTKDLVMGFLNEIPHMTLTKSLVRLALILLQHPKVAISQWSAFYFDKSGPFQSIAGSNPDSDPDPVSDPVTVISPGSLPSAGDIQGPQPDQILLVAPSNASQEGPVVPSGGVCCRNGKRVGLRSSDASNPGAQVSGSNAGGQKRKGHGNGVGEGDGSDRPTKRGKGPIKGLGPGSGKVSGKGRSAGAGKKVPGGGSTSNAPVVWLTNGSPPKLDSGAKVLFERLASLHADSGMAALTTLLRDLVEGTTSDANLMAYDLSLSSILSQCAKLSSARATRDFQVAILYIRLAIHINQ
jgi:hypothetical protein